MSFEESLPQRRGEACLSDLVLDRMIVGELDESGGRAEHLAGCPKCSARLAELRLATPDQLFIAGMAAAATKTARRRRGPLTAGISTLLVAAAAVAVIWWPRPPEGTRSKGGLTFEVVARRQNGVVAPLLPGATLAAGDAIRFRLSSDVDGWLTVIGVDSRPSVTAYAPASGSARRWKAGRDQLVDEGIELDDTRGQERVIAVLCARELTVAEVVHAGERALARAGDPAAVGDLGLGCHQASILFRKAP